MKNVEWFFDFVSPFSYLQFERIAEVESRAHVTLTPVVLAGILNHWGQKGPAEIPAKRRFTYRFVQWQADRQGTALKFPPMHPFNPLRALRLALVAGGGAAAVRAIFRYIWRDGKSLEDESAWKELCESVGVRAPHSINDPAIKDALKQNGQRALDAQVFGVPAFVVDREVFWGLDSTEMLIDYLCEPEKFSRGELARAVDLPIGVQRRGAP
jgi:2-hydroxychromene-2-carboxylate isomerase